MATTMDPKQETLIPGDDAPQLHPVEFDAPSDFRLVSAAIEDRAKALDALAKKADDTGYPKEGRIFKNDADRLRLDLLDRFSAQQELPLATADELEAGVKNELRSIVRQHAKESSEKVDHEAVLLEELGRRLARFATACVEQGFAAGVAYRQATPEVIGLKQLDQLRYKPAGS